jgi:hypothetical protein
MPYVRGLHRAKNSQSALWIRTTRNDKHGLFLNFVLAKRGEVPIVRPSHNIPAKPPELNERCCSPKSHCWMFKRARKAPSRVTCSFMSLLLPLSSLVNSKRFTKHCRPLEADHAS